MQPSTQGKSRNVGIHTTSPGNTLEINSPATVIGPTNSGLRFTDLKSSSNTTSNPGNGVLSVNANGDVIYVSDASGFGVPCPSSNPAVDGLSYNTEKPLNGHNFIFSGNNQGLHRNNMGIGITSCYPGAKLDIYQNSGYVFGSKALKVVNNDPKSIGAYIAAPNGAYCAIFVPQNGSKVNIGYPDNPAGWQARPGLLNVNGDVYVEGDGYYFGGYWGFSDSTLKENIVTIGNAYNALKSITPFSFSFKQNVGLTLPSQKQYGFIAQQVQTVLPELVKEKTIPEVVDSAGNILTPEINYLTINYDQFIPLIVSAMFEQGDRIDSLKTVVTKIHLDTIRNVGYLYASDYRWKTQEQAIPDALKKVNDLKGINYLWDTASCPQNMYVNDKPQIGMIAQDVRSVVPEVVYSDSAGYQYVDYGKLVPLLVEGIKELTARVQALENQQMPNKSMETGQGEIIHEKDVTLASDVIILDQNNPNPFKESTIIRYYIPEYISFAQIIFSDASGRIIKTIDINESGYGQLNVMAEKLSSGIYNYSIVADGKIVDSKKMVCAK